MRFRGVRFVDTPGLESVLSHNTDASMEWLPNVGLAIVAVGVDPPLSQRDVELIRQLNRYTPNISLLLTKVDVLQEDEQRQVEEFVRAQLKRHWSESIPVYPYSIRSGYETIRKRFEEALVSLAVEHSGEQRRAILARKVETLLRECAEYLALAVKAAEAADSERAILKRKILGEKKSLDDSKLSLRLIVRHTATNAREEFARVPREARTRDRCAARERIRATLSRLDEIARRGGPRVRSMAGTGGHRGDDPLVRQPPERLSRSSTPSRPAALAVPPGFSKPHFRANHGDPRRTAAHDGSGDRGQGAAHSGHPDRQALRSGVGVDLLLDSMSLAQGIVRRHFRRTIAEVVFKNLSRLASQWEQSVNTALYAMDKRGGGTPGRFGRHHRGFDRGRGREGSSDPLDLTG